MNLYTSNAQVSETASTKSNKRRNQTHWTVEKKLALVAARQKYKHLSDQHGSPLWRSVAQEMKDIFHEHITKKACEDRWAILSCSTTLTNDGLICVHPTLPPVFIKQEEIYITHKEVNANDLC
jgi:hypothetical protein